MRKTTATVRIVLHTEDGKDHEWPAVKLYDLDLSVTSLPSSLPGVEWRLMSDEAIWSIRGKQRLERRWTPEMLRQWAGDLLTEANRMSDNGIEEIRSAPQ